MYFNEFASGMDATDLTKTEEFRTLLENASQLKIPFKTPSRYIGRNVVVNGLRLHMLEWGEASLPPVLLLHGGGLSAHTWDFVSLALSDRYHVVALDQRGHGDSEWPRDWDVGIQAMKQDVAEIIQGFGPEKPIVIGHSMSGRVSMSLLSEQDLAKKLVIVDIGPSMGRPDPNAEVSPEVAEEAARRARIDALPWQWTSVEDYVESIAGAVSSQAPELIERNLGYNLLQRADGMIVSKVLRRSGANIAYNPEVGSAGVEDLKRIACPTLVIRGERSPLFSREAAKVMLEALPQGNLVTVAGAGHNVHTQNRLGFLAAIEPFLAS